MNRDTPPPANRRPEVVSLLITAALSKAALLKKHEIESVSLLVNVKVEQAPFGLDTVRKYPVRRALRTCKNLMFCIPK